MSFMKRFLSHTDTLTRPATVASQTAETEKIRTLTPRLVLLSHGTGDRTLSHRCSKNLFQRYGERDGWE